MRKILRAIAIYGGVCIFCLLGACQIKLSQNVIVEKDYIESDILKAELNDVKYEDGYLCGTINIYDVAIGEYCAEHSDELENIKYFAEKYKMMISYGATEEELVVNSKGYTYKSSENSFYTQNFKHYIPITDDTTINICLSNIDEALVIYVEK